MAAFDAIAERPFVRTGLLFLCALLTCLGVVATADVRDDSGGQEDAGATTPSARPAPPSTAAAGAASPPASGPGALPGAVIGSGTVPGAATPAAPAAAPPTVPTTGGATPAPSDAGGYTVGAGVSAMVFPEKPGLTVAESKLTPYTGPRTFDSGTHTYSNCLVTGERIHLPENSTAQITFRNCKFRISDDQMILGQGGNLTIEHSLFDGALAGNEPALVLEGGGVVRYSEFINDTDHIRLASNGTAEWNWIHQPLLRTEEGNAHADGIEVYYAARDRRSPSSGPHVFVRHNYIAIDGAEGANSALNITNDFGPIDGVRVEGNTFMNGGGYSLFLRSDGYCNCGGDNRNIEIVANRWFATGDDAWGGYYGTHSWSPEVGITNWSGNRLFRADGTAVEIEEGKPQP